MSSARTFSRRTNVLSVSALSTVAIGLLSTAVALSGCDAQVGERAPGTGGSGAGGTMSGSGGAPVTTGSGATGLPARAAASVTGGASGRTDAGASDSRAGGALGGASGVGGSVGTGGAGGAAHAQEIFSTCRFHFGTIDSKAKSAGAALISQIDYFTPGWMLGSTFDHQGVCNDTKPGGGAGRQGAGHCRLRRGWQRQTRSPALRLQRVGLRRRKPVHGGRPVHHPGLGEDPERLSQLFTGIRRMLRHDAAHRLRDGARLVSIYRRLADPTVDAGAGRAIHVAAGDGAEDQPAQRSLFHGRVTVGRAGQRDGQRRPVVLQLRHVPVLVHQHVGRRHQRQHRQDPLEQQHDLGGLHQVTGKPILADTGYGANGISAGPDPAWDVAANINARIADGVVSIAQYNPSATWSTTISSDRSQLVVPPLCP